MMTQEAIIEWIRARLEHAHYAQAADLARDFYEEHQISRTSDPNFRQFMNASIYLANEIALQVGS